MGIINFFKKRKNSKDVETKNLYYSIRKNYSYEELWLDNEYRIDDVFKVPFEELLEPILDDKKLVSDTEYLKYSIWEKENYLDLMQKYMPNTIVFQGSNPNVIFSGGCLGCKSQEKYNIDRCMKCSYFRHNYLEKKKNLFIN